jgi:hypothetical protein
VLIYLPLTGFLSGPLFEMTLGTGVHCLARRAEAKANLEEPPTRIWKDDFQQACFDGGMSKMAGGKCDDPPQQSMIQLLT